MQEMTTTSLKPRPMPRTIGFSTGALTKGNVRLALEWMSKWDKKLPAQLCAVELSALRHSELLPLIKALPEMERSLKKFKFISVHAPSRYPRHLEREVAQQLDHFTALGWPIVVHPDAIYDIEVWKAFGENLLIENMDDRKPIGRTAQELDIIFKALPGARLCFDIGHVQQIDPTMSQAMRIVERFGNRIAQIHLSAVDSLSAHRPLNTSIINVFDNVASWLGRDIPVILETPVSQGEMVEQVELVCKTRKARLLLKTSESTPWFERSGNAETVRYKEEQVW